MKLYKDIKLIRQFSEQQTGIFSISDLRCLFADKHQSSLARRIQALEQETILKRFVRGFYVTPQSFSLPVLSQRLAPESYLSFGIILAKALWVGTTSDKEVWAVKVGRSRKYEGIGYRVIHLGVVPSLMFGYREEAGICMATPEKALIDTLYFHLRGKKYGFDIFSDIRLSSVNKDIIQQYLERYKNKKFATFVKGLLNDRDK